MFSYHSFYSKPRTWIDGSDHVLMFPLWDTECHFRSANQIQSCLCRVEKPSTFFHSPQQLQHDDISSGGSLSSHMVALGENG